jgi:two-component system, NtrC family, sensor kinase
MCPDMLADREYAHELALAGNWRASVAVPILHDGQPIGAITVGKAEAVPFSERQIQLLSTFADQAVIAIENVRLFNQTQEALEQQTATADVLKVISRSTFDLKTVLNTLVECSASLCEAYDSTIHQPDGKRLLMVAHYGPINVESLPLIRGTVAGRTFLDGQTVHIADLQSAVEEYPESSENARRLGFHAILSVPLMREGVAIGVIGLRRTAPQPFSERQVALLQTFADQAVIAIENVRLFDSVETRTRSLSESLEQQTATSEVLKIISSSPGELGPVFNAMLDYATRICEAKFGNLFLREGDAFRAVAIHGAQAYVEGWQREPLIVLRDHPGIPLDRLARIKEVLHITI